MQNKVIALLNSCQSWGGGEKWHFDTACFLRDSGYQVIFFCHPGSDIECKLKQEDITTEPLKISNLSFLNLVKRYRIATRFAQLNIDVLLLNTPADMKFAAPVAKRAGIAKVIFRRGMPHRIKNNCLNRYLFNHCVDLVIANSHAVKNSLNQQTGGIVPPQKIKVVENGISFNGKDLLLAPHKATDSTLIISSAGRMVKQKNQLALVELAKRLKQSGLAFTFQLAGTGQLEPELRFAVKLAELSNEFQFLGFVTDMSAQFSRTDIFVFPSLYEGSPNTLIEAAAAGKAIVAFDIPPNRELLPDQSMARLVPLNDIEAMTSSVLELAQSQALRTALGMAAQRQIKEHYSLEKVRNKLLALL